MTPRQIPDPPTLQRRKIVSFRFSEQELENLDDACVKLAKHWKVSKCERSDLVRAALSMIYKELDEEVDTEGGG